MVLFIYFKMLLHLQRIAANLGYEFNKLNWIQGVTVATILQNLINQNRADSTHSAARVTLVLHLQKK